MRPGEIITCARCGARSEPLHTTGGRRFEEGGVLIATWTKYPYPRHDVVSGEVPLELCLPCDDERLGFPAPRSAREDPYPAVSHGPVTRAGPAGGSGGPLERSDQLALF